MRKKSVSALALISLGLTACSTASQDAATETASPVPVTTTSEVASDGDTDNSSEQSAASTTETEEEEAEVSDETTTTEPSPYGEVVTSERGNMVKEIGQLAGMSNPESGIPFVDFRVTAIEPNYTCTAEWFEQPENGNFIAVTMEIQTTQELTKMEPAEFWISNYEFKIIGPDGTRENDSDGNSWACLRDSEKLPDTIGPSETVSGKLVLDSQYTSGALVYAPYITDGGWEWIF